VSDVALRFAYAFNVLVLAPVVAALLTAPADRPLAAFSGLVDDSPALRWLVIALWSTILLGSLAGLFDPQSYRLILAAQICYKTIWLVGYALPVAKAQGLAALPWGVTGVFLFVVLVWPLLLLSR
jgi:hypothetical protein